MAAPEQNLDGNREIVRQQAGVAGAELARMRSVDRQQQASLTGEIASGTGWSPRFSGEVGGMRVAGESVHDRARDVVNRAREITDDLSWLTGGTPERGYRSSKKITMTPDQEADWHDAVSPHTD